MYRKELMHKKEMEDQKQIISRVSNYPVVKDTWVKVSEVYQRGKEGNRLLRFCGGIAESSASFALRASQPVINKLPVERVNDYAVSKLETFEEKYPVIVKPTEEMVDAVKTYSSSKLEDARSYSTSQINRFAEVTRLTHLIGAADSVVDSLLPAVSTAEHETVNEETKAPATPLVRVQMLSDKVKRRAYDNAMSKAGAIKQRSQEAVAKLVHTVDLIDFAKRSVTVRVDYAVEKATSLYEEVTRESGEEELPKNAGFEKKAIFAARKITKNVRTTIITVTEIAGELKIRYQPLISDVYNYAESNYTVSKKYFHAVIVPFVLRMLEQQNYVDVSKYLSRLQSAQPIGSPLPSTTSDTDDEDLPASDNQPTHNSTMDSARTDSSAYEEDSFNN